MKLKSEFITHRMGDEQVMVAAGTSQFCGIIRSNRTAAFIVDCLKTETTEEEIIAAMLAAFDAPESVVAEDVRRILDTLCSIGALDAEK